MMERRIGIWAAILFLVIASRGCSGDVSAAGKAREKLARSVVDDLETAVEKYWREYSWTFYIISLGTIKDGRVAILKEPFKKELLDMYNVVLKDKMKQAETKVLSSSDKCLFVEATQDSHTTPFNFLYQLILDGDAENPQVRGAFILGGWKRKVLQHEVILDKLRSTIENPEEDIPLDILHEHPLLVLQVVDGESCVIHEASSRSDAINIYKTQFPLLFGEFYELEKTTAFEGDDHFQFTGDIKRRPTGKLICTSFVAATVVGKGFDKRVESIHIIVKKEVAENPGKTAADQLSAGASQGAEAMQIGESSIKRKRDDDTNKGDNPSKKFKVMKILSGITQKVGTETDMESSESAVMDTS